MLTVIPAWPRRRPAYGWPRRARPWRGCRRSPRASRPGGSARRSSSRRGCRAGRVRGGRRAARRTPGSAGSRNGCWSPSGRRACPRRSPTACRPSRCGRGWRPGCRPLPDCAARGAEDPGRALGVGQVTGPVRHHGPRIREGLTHPGGHTLRAVGVGSPGLVPVVRHMVVEVDARAVRGEPPGDRVPDAAAPAGPGDECGASAQGQVLPAQRFGFGRGKLRHGPPMIAGPRGRCHPVSAGALRGEAGRPRAGRRARGPEWWLMACRRHTCTSGGPALWTAGPNRANSHDMRDSSRACHGAAVSEPYRRPPTAERARGVLIARRRLASHGRELA